MISVPQPHRIHNYFLTFPASFLFCTCCFLYIHIFVTFLRYNGFNKGRIAPLQCLPRPLRVWHSCFVSSPSLHIPFHRKEPSVLPDGSFLCANAQLFQIRRKKGSSAKPPFRFHIIDRPSHSLPSAPSRFDRFRQLVRAIFRRIVLPALWWQQSAA